MWKYLIVFILLSISYVESQKNFKNLLQKHRDEFSVLETDEIKPLATEATYRLPNDTEPILYNVILDFGKFHEGDMYFAGSVLIVIRIVKFTNTITLHNAAHITRTTLLKENITISHSYEFDTEREFIIVKSDEILVPEQVVLLTIFFIGSIGTSFRGVYRGSYLNDASEKRYFIATHMQPTFARRVFPCYDEPSFKANFGISVIHNPKFEVLSNTIPEISTELEKGRILTSFSTTPLISTYLVAFVISDFESNSMISANNVQFRALSRLEAINNTQFGLKTAEKALEHYENAFAVPSEMTKLDQVALPQFRSGGMENDAIIFYREDYFLYEPNVTTAYWKEYAAATIVHEVCHIFFGNKLTPHWWSVLWISEGFCRFYEYYMTGKMYPTMRMEELFAVEAAQSILYRDSSLATRPMTWYEEKPDAVDRLFDGIAYSKSASVIRMFFYTLGEKTFNKGLKIYLSKQTTNAEGVAQPKHLYDALQQAVDVDDMCTLEANYKIEELFGSWELQAGYPVLYVERSYNNHSIKFTQNRFTDLVADGTMWNSLWHIPITYASKIDPTHDVRPKLWMPPQRELNIELKELTPDSYFLVNVNQIGYYRVQYDDANWMLIANELSRGNFTNITPNSRAMLIDDAAVFFESKILNVRLFLELIKYLQNDIDYIPWMAATNNLIYMRRILDNGSSKLSDDFRKFLQILLSKTYNEFGVEVIDDEPHYHKHIRNIAINWACQAHLSACLDDIRDVFSEFMEKGLQFPSDHEAALYCNGLLMAGKHEFDFMWNLFNGTDDSKERRLYLESMGCIENEDILMEFIKTIIESDDIDKDSTEWLTIVEAVYANGPIGLSVILRFMRTYYNEFSGLLNSIVNSESSLQSIFRGIAVRINTRDTQSQLNDLLVIYNINNDFAEVIKIITDENLNWLMEYSSDIQDFLNDFLRSGSSGASIFSCFIIMFGSVLSNWIM